MFEYLLFDLDGTLTDPASGITNSFKHVYEHFGMEIPSYEKLCSFIGPPLLETFRKEFGFDVEKADESVRIYREYFAEKGLFENSVYPGIDGLLKKLKENKKHLIVATSKPEIYSVRILEHFSLSSYFDFICGSLLDESRSEKSEVISYALEKCGNPSKEKVLMIGDRKHDVLGAKKNGIKSCGILFGYGTESELEDASADFICKDINELEKICLA